MSESKRTDNFSAARRIYTARSRHFDKAAALLDEASPEVRALVEAHEEAEAEKSIDLKPAEAAE